MKKRVQKTPITYRPAKEDEWLYEALEKERKLLDRPSVNNTVAFILKDYFRRKKRFIPKSQ